jgi:hypothetical protein
VTAEPTATPQHDGSAARRDDEGLGLRLMVAR